VVLLGVVDVFGTVIAGRQVCRSGDLSTMFDATSPPARCGVFDAVMQADCLRQYERSR
jgi:hypothetical protein